MSVHAWGIRYPTHMEWSLDGRLLISERESGRVVDVTDGGDMRGDPPVVAYGMGRPASILPIEPDTVLVADVRDGKVLNIAQGGDVGARAPFASGLESPYSLAALPSG